MYEFDKIADRKGSNCVKWDRQTLRDGQPADIIPLAIADTDFIAMPELVEALTKRAQHPCYGYTFPGPDFLGNFIDWNKRRNDYDIAREEVIVVPGVLAGLSFAIHALVPAGANILLCSPIYNPFYRIIEDHDRKIVTSSLIENNYHYEVDWADLETKLADNCGLFILCNPHNPIGRVWRKDELERIAELCAKYDVLVFSDDIHSDLILGDNTYTPLPNISADAKGRTVMAMAPSKTFNVAGLGCAFLTVHDEELRNKVRKQTSAFHVGTSIFGYAATTAVYGQGEAWLTEQLAYLEGNARFVVDFCDENLPGVKTYMPEGTYLMWLDARGLEMPQEELIALLLDAGVALNNGEVYGAEGVGFMRLNIGTSRSVLEESFKRIAAKLNG